MYIYTYPYHSLSLLVKHPNWAVPGTIASHIIIVTTGRICSSTFQKETKRPRDANDSWVKPPAGKCIYFMFHHDCGWSMWAFMILVLGFYMIDMILPNITLGIIMDLIQPGKNEGFPIHDEARPGSVSRWCRDRMMGRFDPLEPKTNELWNDSSWYVQ